MMYYVYVCWRRVRRRNRECECDAKERRTGTLIVKEEKRDGWDDGRGGVKKRAKEKNKKRGSFAPPFIPDKKSDWLFLFFVPRPCYVTFLSALSSSFFRLPFCSFSMSLPMVPHSFPLKRKRIIPRPFLLFISSLSIEPSRGQYWLAM